MPVIAKSVDNSPRVAKECNVSKHSLTPVSECLLTIPFNRRVKGVDTCFRLGLKSSRWCGVVVRKKGVPTQVLFSCLTVVQNYGVRRSCEHKGVECPRIRYLPRGRGSRVVQVSDRGLPGHEFEPSTTKDPPCRAAMHVKSVES
ncbi:hypothetical protein TNCV_2098081 [Trichonephila clavipes]|nr:hypothetical protein TNCV_2098081 [Trichonephila clavipes]